MNAKIFRGIDSDTAMEAVAASMGQDAFIVSTKRTEDGFEILATKDLGEPLPKRNETKQKNFNDFLNEKFKGETIQIKQPRHLEKYKPIRIDSDGFQSNKTNKTLKIDTKFWENNKSVFLIGSPGSGKTTIASKMLLQREMGKVTYYRAGETSLFENQNSQLVAAATNSDYKRGNISDYIQDNLCEENKSIIEIDEADFFNNHTISLLLERNEVKGMFDFVFVLEDGRSNAYIHRILSNSLGVELQTIINIKSKSDFDAQYLQNINSENFLVCGINFAKDLGEVMMIQDTKISECIKHW